MRTLHLPSHFHWPDGSSPIKRIRESLSELLLWPFLTASFMLVMLVILLFVALNAY